MSVVPFADLMDTLLRSYGMTLPGGMVQEVYTLYFDGQPPAYIVGRADSTHVDVLIEAGRLSSPPAIEQLLSLLDVGTEKMVGRGATVTLHRPTSTAVVWTRQPRAALNTEELRRMLDSVRAHAEFIRERLGTAMLSRQHYSAARLQRLMR